MQMNLFPSKENAPTICPGIADEQPLKKHGYRYGDMAEPKNYNIGTAGMCHLLIAVLCCTIINIVEISHIA